MTYSLALGSTEAHEVNAPARWLNRHGLITGATGQGKSVSLMGMVEGLARLGVPSFVTDIKGDLSGLALPRAPGRAVATVRPLDVYGDAGERFSASLSQMGAVLAARALGLSEAQSGVLEVAFAVAEDEGRPIHTLSQLREVVAHCMQERAYIGARYGLVTPSSVAAIGRAVLQLERSGGADFFSAQPFDLGELTQGRVVNLLHCVELYRNPKLYGAVMLWVLDTLGKTLPEVGDHERPVLCLFLDEAHLLFSECPPAVVSMVENTVRLIRSKGVGVFFATQAPGDLPDGVARQLHLRIQHGLRAVTPRDRSIVKSAAESLPPSLTFRNADMIEKLKPGHALVSFMGEDGQQTPTVLCAMRLPECRLSPLTSMERLVVRSRWSVAVNTARVEVLTERQEQLTQRIDGIKRSFAVGQMTTLSHLAIISGAVTLGMMFNGAFVGGACGFAVSLAVFLVAHQQARHTRK